MVRTIKTRFSNKEENILSEFQAKKFFLFLHFRDYAFEWELKKRMNLTNSQLQRYSEKLNELGYISFRTLSSIEDTVLQECIMQTTPDFKKLWDSDAKLYVITPEGKEQGKKYLAEFLRQAKTNQGVFDLVKQLNLHSSSYRKKYKELKALEESTIPRLVKTPEGISYLRNTKKYYEVKALTNNYKPSESTDLVHIEQNLPDLIQEEKIKEAREITQYGGKYPNLVPKVGEIVLEVDKRQENNVLNENIDTKSLTQELNQQGKFDVLVMQGARLTPLEKKKIDKECRQFLELLEGE